MLRIESRPGALEVLPPARDGVVARKRPGRRRARCPGRQLTAAPTSGPSASPSSRWTRAPAFDASGRSAPTATRPRPLRRTASANPAVGSVVTPRPCELAAVEPLAEVGHAVAAGRGEPVLGGTERHAAGIHVHAAREPHQMAAILDDHQMRHREHEAEMILLLLGGPGPADRLPEADRQGRATRQPRQLRGGPGRGPVGDLDQRDVPGGGGHGEAVIPDPPTGLLDGEVGGSIHLPAVQASFPVVAMQDPHRGSIGERAGPDRGELQKRCPECFHLRHPWTHREPGRIRRGAARASAPPVSRCRAGGADRASCPR